MSIQLGENTKTTWLVGGAIALFAAAATPVLSLFGSVLFVALPGDWFGHGDVGDYFRFMWEATWPFTLAELAIAGAALVLLIQAFRAAPNLSWGVVAKRALTLLIPAALAVILVIRVINSIRDNNFGPTF